MFVCPNVVDQGVGVIAQLVCVNVKIMPCSYACDVIPSDLQGVQGYTSSGTLFRCLFQIRGSEAFLTTTSLHSSLGLSPTTPIHFIALYPTFLSKALIMA